MNSITDTPRVPSGTFPIAVRPLGTWTYAVTSSSDPGRAPYTVDTLVGTCTCKAGEHGRYCRHRQTIDDPELFVRALVPPTPRQVTVAALEDAPCCNWCERPAGPSGYCALHQSFADVF